MNIIVSTYNPLWKEEYNKESQVIAKILGSQLVDIQHIGSTSVENLKAKPIIDIMPIVKDINEVDKYNLEFEELGYECMGTFGMANRRYFRKGGEDRTHQIHIFEEGDSMNIIRHLAVRDYLRTHPTIADEYGELKAKLAKEFPNDIDGYGDGKEDFMKVLEEQALLWYHQ